jgi:hypothetical protein
MKIHTNLFKCPIRFTLDKRWSSYNTSSNSDITKVTCKHCAYHLLKNFGTLGINKDDREVLRKINNVVF